MSEWTHPTGKAPKRIAIIGLGPTMHDWHGAHVAYTPPLDAVDEVWTCNKGFRTIRCDIAFIMDDLKDEARKSPRYGKDIANAPCPVITSTVDQIVKDSWPLALQYPLDEVLKFWGSHLAKTWGEGKISEEMALEAGLNEAAYFHNSIPYMLAYAGSIGVESIAMFGVDYDFPGSSARENDKPNAEYWVAALQYGLGVRFQVPSRSTIMHKNQPRWFYGFNGRQPF